MTPCTLVAFPRSGWRRPPHVTLLDVKVHLASAARTLDLPRQTSIVDADTLAIWIVERSDRGNAVQRAMNVPSDLT